MVCRIDFNLYIHIHIHTYIIHIHTSCRNTIIIRTYRSVSVPPISPSKAGSKMWGNRTPLSKKGHALKVDSNKWCCTVCMYVENPKDAQNCIVCDSPNYNANKVSKPSACMYVLCMYVCLFVKQFLFQLFVQYMNVFMYVCMYVCMAIHIAVSFSNI